jgi:hypothetical protein
MVYHARIKDQADPDQIYYISRDTDMQKLESLPPADFQVKRSKLFDIN